MKIQKSKDKLMNPNEGSTNDEETNESKKSTNKFVTFKIKQKQISKKEKRKIICKKYREKKKHHLAELEKEYKLLRSELLSLSKNQGIAQPLNEFISLIANHITSVFGQSYLPYLFPSFPINTFEDLLMYRAFIQEQKVNWIMCYFTTTNNCYRSLIAKQMIILISQIERMLSSVLQYIENMRRVEYY